MASLNLFALAVLCFLATVVVGQNMPPNDNAPRVIVDGTLMAGTFTDGTTIIHDGEISATSMNLRGDLFGQDATFVFVTASDTTVADLTVMDLATLKGLNVTMLNVLGDSSFGANVAINGSLTAGGSTLNETTVNDLEVQGDANFEDDLFANSNIQVGADINVGGNSRLFGDVLANMTATVEESLTVGGDAASDSLFVSGTTMSTTVQVDEMTRITNLHITGDMDVGANLYLGGDLSVDGDASFKLALSADDATLMGNLQVGMNATIGGDIKATSGMFGNVTVNQDLSVEGSLSASGYIHISGETTVAGNVGVEGDISAGNMISAVEGDFEAMDVDTATIVSLTSTFVTSSTFDSEDATVLGTFIVNGPTTMESLTVKSTSTLNDVTAESVNTEGLSAESLTVGMLTVTGHASLDTMSVNTMLIVGRPTELDGWVSTFESVYVDSFYAVESNGSTAEITNLVGNTLNYETIMGVNGTFDRSDVEFADITAAQVTSGTITDLFCQHGLIDQLQSIVIDSDSITASGDSTVDQLRAGNMTTVSLEAPAGWLGSDVSKAVVTTNVTSMNSTLETLTSTSGTITWLQSNSGTFSRVTATNAWFQNLTGNGFTFINGNLTQLRSNNFTASLMYNVTGGASTNWVFSQVGKLNTTDARTLYVTENAWFQNLTLRGDTQVEGFSSFQQGFISGEAVVSTLTVVGDTSFAELSVTGPSFLTDLWVKRVTITDSFDAQTATLMSATAETVSSTGHVELDGTFNVSSRDSLLKGNLVVQGTTQFQTGSFSRIGTALITTTDMEAFNMDVANGLFGGITVDDLTVTRGANFERSIQLAPMVGSGSGSEFSFFSSRIPTVLTGSSNNQEFFVNAGTVFHSGFETVDQLVITNPTDPSKAALRVTGDGALDFLEGSLYFRNLDIGGGIVFENEQNVAWTRSGVATTRTLSLGTSTHWFSYSDLIDRDLVDAGTWIDPARFSEPSDVAQTDLLTLAPGQYRVSGNVELGVNSFASADSIIAVTAGVDAYLGTESSGTPGWSAECVATFGVIAGTDFGGSCYFSGVLTVAEGEVMTLRTKALWNFSSATLANSLIVDPTSSLVVEELFDRTSQNLS